MIKKFTGNDSGNILIIAALMLPLLLIVLVLTLDLNSAQTEFSNNNNATDSSALSTAEHLQKAMLKLERPAGEALTPDEIHKYALEAWLSNVARDSKLGEPDLEKFSARLQGDLITVKGCVKVPYSVKEKTANDPGFQLVCSEAKAPVKCVAFVQNKEEACPDANSDGSIEKRRTYLCRNNTTHNWDSEWSSWETVDNTCCVPQEYTEDRPCPIGENGIRQEGNIKVRVAKNCGEEWYEEVIENSCKCFDGNPSPSFTSATANSALKGCQQPCLKINWVDYDVSCTANCVSGSDKDESCNPEVGNRKLDRNWRWKPGTKCSVSPDHKCYQGRDGGDLRLQLTKSGDKCSNNSITYTLSGKAQKNEGLIDCNEPIGCGFTSDKISVSCTAKYSSGSDSGEECTPRGTEGDLRTDKWQWDGSCKTNSGNAKCKTIKKDGKLRLRLHNYSNGCDKNGNCNEYTLTAKAKKKPGTDKCSASCRKVECDATYKKGTDSSEQCNPKIKQNGTASSLSKSAWMWVSGCSTGKSSAKCSTEIDGNYLSMELKNYGSGCDKNGNCQTHSLKGMACRKGIAAPPEVNCETDYRQAKCDMPDEVSVCNLWGGEIKVGFNTPYNDQQGSGSTLWKTEDNGRYEYWIGFNQDSHKNSLSGIVVWDRQEQDFTLSGCSKYADGRQQAGEPPVRKKDGNLTGMYHSNYPHCYYGSLPEDSRDKCKSTP